MRARQTALLKLQATNTTLGLVDGSELLTQHLTQSARHNAKTHNLLWLGQRGEDACIISPSLHVTAIICFNWSKTLQAWGENIPIFSVEQQEKKRRNYTSAQINKLAELWKKLNKSKETTTIFPYTAVKQAFNLPKILGPLEQIVAHLNNKYFQRQLFTKWGFLTPKTILLKKIAPLASISQTLNNAEIYILTPLSGSLGNGVRKLNLDQLSLENNLTKNSTHLLSNYIEGISINTSAVVTGDEIILGWPSVQILGESACNSPYEFSFCGSDFSQTHLLHPDDRKKLAELAFKLGMHLRQLGFLGFFGADWVLDNSGNWWLIEVNPRLQGSTFALTLAEREAGYSPIIDHWISSYKQDSSQKKYRGNRAEFTNPIRGSMLNIYASNTYRQNEILDIRIKSHQKPAYIIGLPTKNTLIQKDSSVCKIFIPNHGLKLDKNQLHPTERKRISEVLTTLNSR